MKAIKLIGILIVFIGAIVLALNWKSLFPQKADPNQAPTENRINITDKCKEISDAWEAQEEWNDSLYHALRDDIDQSNNMKLLNAEGFNTITNRLREEAANKVAEGYKKALHASPFSDAGLQRNYKGAKTLKDTEKMGSDSRISHVINLQDLYNKIKDFIGRKHTITPHFNGKSWTSFDQLQRKILEQARQLRSNALYNELSHLPGFKDGLDEAKLKATTNGYRRSFYDTLVNQIINRVKSEEKLDYFLDKLTREDSRSADKLEEYIESNYN